MTTAEVYGCKTTTTYGCILADDLDDFANTQRIPILFVHNLDHYQTDWKFANSPRRPKFYRITFTEVPGILGDPLPIPPLTQKLGEEK